MTSKGSRAAGAAGEADGDESENGTDVGEEADGAGDSAASVERSALPAGFGRGRKTALMGNTAKPRASGTARATRVCTSKKAAPTSARSLTGSASAHQAEAPSARIRLRVMKRMLSKLAALSP